MRTLALLAAAALASGCDTTHARMPTIAPHEAIELVTQDLTGLADQPTEVRWLRAYRHFDTHLEPHVPVERRLELELAFGGVRQALAAEAPPELLRRLCADLAATLEGLAELQPQD